MIIIIVPKEAKNMKDETSGIRIIDTKDIPPLPTVKCLRCGHTWQNRTINPRQCPKCKSPSWNKPKRETEK